MKMNPIASNMTEVQFNGSAPGIGITVLFSYKTPVAAYSLSPEWFDKYGAAFIKTDCRWSVTTSKHINKWLDGAKAVEVSQETIDSLV